jgi:hypothetical protein
METGYLATAFLVGLLGGAHCVGMCGGIVGTLTLGLPSDARSSLARIFPYQLGYNGGRVAGYMVAGALMGALGAMMAGIMPLQYAQRTLYVLAALFMIALGLYLGGWWRGLAAVERLGAMLWRRIEPFGRHLLPIRSPYQAIALGFVWAWIPCGLVYSVLIWAVSAGTAAEGALVMLAFGLGTLPNLVALGMLAGAAARLAASALVRQVAGITVMGFGLYALWQLYA